MNKNLQLVVCFVIILLSAYSTYAEGGHGDTPVFDLDLRTQTFLVIELDTTDITTLEQVHLSGAISTDPTAETVILSGLPLIVEYVHADGLIISSDFTVSTSNTFTGAFESDIVGQWSVRVSFAGNETLKNSISPEILFSVVEESSEGEGEVTEGEGEVTEGEGEAIEGEGEMIEGEGEGEIPAVLEGEGEVTEGLDTDGDGLPNSMETEFHVDPNNPDTDGDGMPDGFEVDNNLELGVGFIVYGLNRLVGAGYGWNLHASEKESYYFIALDFLRTFETFRAIFSPEEK